MRTTRLNLSVKSRKTSTTLLQIILTDALDLRLAVKQAHWTVKGPNFHQLHTLFDSFIAPLDGEIDAIAERLATLGDVPDGRAIDVAQNSSLAPYPLDATDGDAHLDALVERFSIVGGRVRDAIDQSAEAGDAGTSDLLTGTSRFLDQSVWFLESHFGPSDQDVTVFPQRQRS